MDIEEGQRVRNLLNEGHLRSLHRNKSYETTFALLLGAVLTALFPGGLVAYLLGTISDDRAAVIAWLAVSSLVGGVMLSYKVSKGWDRDIAAAEKLIVQERSLAPRVGWSVPVRLDERTEEKQ